MLTESLEQRKSRLSKPSFGQLLEVHSFFPGTRGSRTITTGHTRPHLRGTLAGAKSNHLSDCRERFRKNFALFQASFACHFEKIRNNHVSKVVTKDDTADGLTGAVIVKTEGAATIHGSKVSVSDAITADEISEAVVDGVVNEDDNLSKT